MRQLARGERVEPIEFRNSDYWSEFADEFNAIAARLQMASPSKAMVNPAITPIEDADTVLAS